MKGLPRAAIGLPAVAVLAALAVVAVRHGTADLLAVQGRTAIRTADPGPAALDPQAWAPAQSRFERALQLDPGEPALAEDLGRLHELRSRGAPGADAGAELGIALGYFRASLARRPTSPYTWANLAMVKSGLGQLDAEFRNAVDRAARLGPWEPEVQLALADIGLRHWDRLPPPVRATLHAAMGRALKRQDGRLFELAQSYGRMDVMCATPGVARSKRAVRCI